MTSHALKSFWKCYDQLPAHVQKLAVRSLRELFVDDLDLLLEHLAGVHTVVARVSRASLQPIPLPLQIYWIAFSSCVPSMFHS